ncbi:MAG: O-methyltransferase [Planctomycetes bacterium]|nr:O-methyltransferase [Planctomycetota bacterium]
MSQTSTRLSEAHYGYIAARARAEGAFLSELKKEASRAGIPSIAISPEQAAFMGVLLRSAGAKDVVEVGTLAGYSAISMARALPTDGHVRTIEFSATHADFAEAQIARSDVAGKITVHRGAGLDVLPTFEAESADAAFLDADKVNYTHYLEHCLRIVRPGGLIMVDNAMAFGHLLDEENQTESVVAIRAFNDQMAADPRVEGVIVPLGDGFWVATKV